MSAIRDVDVSIVCPIVGSIVGPAVVDSIVDSAIVGSIVGSAIIGSIVGSTIIGSIVGTTMSTLELRVIPFLPFSVLDKSVVHQQHVL